jgi:AraC-like DNA-binding protein
MMAANERLVGAVVNWPAVVIGGRKLICSQCHYGAGLYQKGFGVTWDTHEELQIEIAIFGNYDFDIEGEKVRLKPGDSLAIAAHKPHVWRTPTGGFLLGLHVQALSPEGELQALRLRGDTSFDIVHTETVANYLRPLIELTEKKSFDEFDAIRLQCRLKLLIVEILAHVLEADSFGEKSEEGGKSLRYAFLIRNVTEQIERKLSEPLLIEDLARNAGVSVRHLNRLFGQFKGESIHRFIVHQRVMRARHLLKKNPDLPIKAVAAESGFADASHLGNAFRRHFHISPGRFVESLRR